MLSGDPPAYLRNARCGPEPKDREWTWAVLRILAGLGIAAAILGYGAWSMGMLR